MGSMGLGPRGNLSAIKRIQQTPSGSQQNAVGSAKRYLTAAETFQSLQGPSVRHL